MMKVYISRHGETEWNKLGLVQSQLDSPLTKKGIEDLENLSKSIENLKFDRVYSSDLPRAVKSAEIIIGNRNIEITKLPELREILLIDWQGKNLETIKKEDPRFETYVNNPESFHMEGSEDFYSFTERVNNFLQGIVKSGDESVLIVTHGVVVSAIFNIIEKNPIEKFWTNRVVYGSRLSEVLYDGEFKIIKKVAPWGNLLIP